MPVDLRPGGLYIFKARRPDRMYHLIDDFASAGYTTLCVSRVHPEQLKEDFGIPEEIVFWLSNSVGTRNISPQNVGVLTDNLVRFYEGSAKPVAVLDGLEYLVMQNDFGKMLKLLNFLYETVIVRKGILIATIDPRAFSTQELAFIEKDSIIVEEQEIVTIDGSAVDPRSRGGFHQAWDAQGNL